MARRLVCCVVVLLAILSAPVSGQFVYSWDDGIPDNAIGMGPTDPGSYDFIWLNRFLRHPGFRQITSVQVAFGYAGGHGLQIGSPLEVLLYDDPTGGDPRDATLVRHVHAQVQDLGFGSFNTFPIPPVIVNGFFHVGVVLRARPAPFYPAAIDLTPPHTSDVSRQGFLAGHMDVYDLSTLPTTQFATVETRLGFDGNYLIRATGILIPEPTTLVLPLVGMWMLRRRAVPSRNGGRAAA